MLDAFVFQYSLIEPKGVQFKYPWVQPTDLPDNPNPGRPNKSSYYFNLTMRENH